MSKWINKGIFLYVFFPQRKLKNSSYAIIEGMVCETEWLLQAGFKRGYSSALIAFSEEWRRK